MEFTTLFELQSQTTRLLERAPCAPETKTKDGILNLYDAPFQRTCVNVPDATHFFKLQLGLKSCQSDLKFELFPLHSPLLGESLLVSFPPLIDMLKFSGYSCLI